MTVVLQSPENEYQIWEIQILLKNECIDVEMGDFGQVFCAYCYKKERIGLLHNMLWDVDERLCNFRVWICFVCDCTGDCFAILLAKNNLFFQLSTVPKAQFGNDRMFVGGFSLLLPRYNPFEFISPCLKKSSPLVKLPIYIYILCG